MATLSSTTGTISSAGIGSGLDVNSIVTQLMAVERQPLGRLQGSAVGLQTQLSAYGQLQSLVSSLQDASRALHTPGTFKQSGVTTSDATGVTATSAAGAVLGSYAVVVSDLAAGQSVVSPAGQYVDGTSVIGTGSLTIRSGTWDAGRTTFTPKTGSADATIVIGAADNTLEKVRDKINGANAGVVASIVTDSNGARLSLQSSETGAHNGFRVTVADSDGDSTDNAGLSRLAYNGAIAGTSQLVFARAAADATATINGIAVSATTNTLANVVEGMTFSLGKVSATAVNVNVTRNTEVVKTTIAGFVTAYNALHGFLAATTKYDVATKQASLLQGDGTTNGIFNQLRTMVSPASGASPVFQTLSSIGVRLQRDGTLKVDDAALGTAMANLPELQKALASVDPTGDATDGFGKRFAEWADRVLASDGAIPGKTKTLQSRIAANQKDQAALADRLEATEARLRAQYSALDATMAKANALSKYVQQQFYNLKQGSGLYNDD